MLGYPLNMNLFYLGGLIALSCMPTAVPLSASCEEDWEIDWDRQPPDFSDFRLFSNPGEILPNITINNALRFLGAVWNAPSVQEIAGRVCVQFGPMIYAFYPLERFRRECDVLVTSLKNRQEGRKGEELDIQGTCISLWDQFGVDNKTDKFVADNNPCSFDPGLPRFVQLLCRYADPLGTIYANDVLTKASRVALDLLKWLGPSPFSGDFYGACSAGRILLSSDIDHIVDETKNLLAYLVADILEYMSYRDACMNEGGFQDMLHRLPLSIQSGELICDFLSRDPSQKEYLEKGVALTNSFLDIFVNESLCIDMLSFVKSFDFGLTNGLQLTGMDLSFEKYRLTLCRDITSVFSKNSHYAPTPYAFPQDQNITDVTLFGLPGQPLPNFSFRNTMDLLGAFFRSDTLLDGGILLCEVFESFLSGFKPSFANICPLLRNKDTAELEKICLQMVLPTGNHPTLRIPTLNYIAVTEVDMGRKYFKLSEISRDHVCVALDDFFNSKNNLQSFVRFGVDVYLAELLPIADNICKDYNSVTDYLMNSSSIPSSEFIELVKAFTELILTQLRFSDQQDICQTISAGIDSSSGRAKGSLVEDMQENGLLFLTDSDLCQKSLKSFERVFEILKPKYHFTDLLNKYTGYNSTIPLCDDLSDFMTMCADPNPVSNAVTLELNGLLMVRTSSVGGQSCARSRDVIMVKSI